MGFIDKLDTMVLAQDIDLSGITSTADSNILTVFLTVVRYSIMLGGVAIVGTLVHMYFESQRGGDVSFKPLFAEIIIIAFLIGIYKLGNFSWIGL